MPRFLLLPLVILAATVLAACTAAKEDATPTPSAGSPTATPGTPTPTEPPGGAGGGGFEGTIVPITTPFPTPPPVPADWASYTDPEGRFTFRIPGDWFVSQGGAVISWDPATWSKPYFPPNSTKVDVVVLPLNGGITGCEPTGGTPASLGGIEGWQVVQQNDPTADTPSIPEDSKIRRSHAVAADYKGSRYCLSALFTQDVPDEVTFSQIVDSFGFID